MQPFQTILFAADFSQNSKEAFRVACSLAAADKTRMIILHVVSRLGRGGAGLSRSDGDPRRRQDGQRAP